MEAFARVGVFVQVRAVEVGQTVRVAREVRRHPVEQQPQPERVATIDEAAETHRIAEARRGRIQAHRLVAPGAIERVFADRQQLDVREAHLQRVGQQRVGQLLPVEEAVALFGLAAPRAEVDFVDAHRRVERIRLLACGRGRCQRWHA